MEREALATTAAALRDLHRRVVKVRLRLLVRRLGDRVYTERLSNEDGRESTRSYRFGVLRAAHQAGYLLVCRGSMFVIQCYLLTLLLESR